MTCSDCCCAKFQELLPKATPSAWFFGMSIAYFKKQGRKLDAVIHCRSSRTMMESITTDVLIIGAGAAGIRAAIAACKNNADVVMVAADDVTYGGSTFSEISKGWGIQGLVDAERTAEKLEDFYGDIIQVGLGQSDSKLVRILVEESGPRIEDLISYGLKFKRGHDGNYIRARGCFSETERAFLTSDIANIRQTFLSILRRWPVRVVTGSATELILGEGICLGAWIIKNSGTFVQISAKSTILATGGGSGIYKDHMGCGGGFGDGYALAYLAGAELKNMEFVQFAMGLKHNGSRKFLPTGKLDLPNKIVNSSGGDILKHYMPDNGQRLESLKARQKHMPFSCRDSSGSVDIAVARARRLHKTLYWLDDEMKNNTFEVVHFAHAFNGGVKINERGESTVPGLYAAGEAATGAYGADRIGGTMMTATQVFGKRAGQFAAQRAKRLNGMPARVIGKDETDRIDRLKLDDDVLHALAAIESRVKEAMGQYAGILRSNKGLKKCKKIVKTCADQLRDLEFHVPANFERYYKVRNLIITANLVTKNSLARKESKGSHYREDDLKTIEGTVK